MPLLIDRLRQERLLMGYTALMLAFLLAAWFLWFADERMVRDVNVWVKPMKFMASTAAFALTTALFLSLLPALVRKKRALQVMVWVLVLTSTFEVVYITWQGALGNGSHFNMASPVLAFMYGLMGFAALALTSTQGYLAWVVNKHGLIFGGKVFTQSVALGLGLTFVLATIGGFMLGNLQPPAGQGIPLVGWHLTGGDLRPAHFLGVHANQIIPIAGLILVTLQKKRISQSAAMGMLYLGALAYVLIWLWLSLLGLNIGQ
jgi:hypothetical protein